MGARLASLAANPAWSGLTPPARLVFTFMCLRTYDRDKNGVPAGTYWGGHRELATRIYGDDNPSLLRKIRRHITELVLAGAIERIETARGRGQAGYRVTPENLPGINPDGPP